MAEFYHCPKCGSGYTRCRCADTPSIPPQPTSVEEARASLWDQLVDGTVPSVKDARETVIEGLRDGGYCLSAEDIADRLIASVRAEEREKVRAMVEGMPRYVCECFGEMAEDEKVTLSGVLAGLAKMETQ